MKDIMELLEKCRNTVKNKFTIEEIEKIEESDNFIKAMIETNNLIFFIICLMKIIQKCYLRK